jgi:endonuclease-3
MKDISSTINIRLKKSTPAERAKALCAALPRIYPNAHCELNFSHPLELLIATILSAQCTDVQVNKVTPGLFKKYRTARDYAEADPAQLEHDLRAIGLYRAKAKNIRACCRLLVDEYNGKVPDARRPTWFSAMPSARMSAWSSIPTSRGSRAASA